MRILWYNKLQDATITVSSESTEMSANFPKENMLVQALSIPFKSIQPSIEVTITFDSATVINAIAFAGHNLSTFRYRTYDESDALIVDNLITSLLSTEMLYSSTALVKKIILNMNASEYVQVGYLSIGEYYQMPSPLAYYEEAIDITNERNDNIFGQVYGSNGVMLQTYAPDFAYVSKEKLDEIVEIVNSARNFNSLFVDMTEDAHDFKLPLYATLNFASFSNSRYSRGIKTYGFKLNIQEAR